MGLTLDKQQEKVKLTLKKVVQKDVPPVQIKLLNDVSGSIQNAYNQSGFMFPILQRCIALASIIDPDKVVQIIAFDNEAYELGDFGVENFDSIWEVFKNPPRGMRFWGGTSYAAAFNKINDLRTPSTGFFGKLLGKSKKVADEAELIIFLTDGQDGGSESKFRAALDKAANKNTYVMCIGAGGSEHYYSTLKSIADEKDNVGYVYIKDAHNISDDQFYDLILSGEFGKWLDNTAA